MGSKIYKEILFLDIDGVLNSMASHMYNEYLLGEDHRELHKALCPIATSNLRFLLEKRPDLNIVISSTWRKVFKLNGVKDILKKYGIKKSRVVGVTPLLEVRLSGSSPRGREILHWLSKHKTESFAIVDDNSYDFTNHKELKGKILYTDTITGLTMHDVREISKIIEPDRNILPFMLF